MSKLLLGSIDLNKLDKSQIVAKDKEGNPFKNGAKYINIAVWVNDEPDQYGNHASIQMGDKENKNYIGNLKEYQKEGPVATKPSFTDGSDEEDLLPF